MSRLAACPKCRNQFSLPELTGPATIACPFCGAHINIKVKGAPPPQAPPPAMVVQPAMAVARAMPVDDDEDDDEEEEDRPRKKKKKKGAKSAAPAGSSDIGMKVAIVGGILLLTILSIVFAFWWFLKGDNKPNFTPPPKPTDAQSRLNDRQKEDEEEYAEATGTEKFEIADKALSHQEFLTSFNPTVKLPGLQQETIKETGESLATEVLNRVKLATVYIETETAEGGGTGSGFFACEKGLVVTNAHVISMLEEGAKAPNSVRVYLNHGKSDQVDYKAVIVKVDRKNDLAILRLPGAYKSSYPEPLPLASSMTARETQKVFSLGFPFGNSTGKEVTVTSMSVSSIRYREGRINVVQFSGAPLNFGNSGGPIVDLAGRVVSVAVRIITDRSDGSTISNTGISFGVPCDEVSALYHGRPDRLDLYPPTRKGSILQVPMVLRMTDYSSRKAAPKIRITPGDETSPPRKPAPGEDASALKPSEARQVYAGLIEFPDLEAGKVYWIYPQVTFGEDEVTWLDPQKYKPGKILEDKPLPSTVGEAASLGELKLQQRYDWNINTSRGSLESRTCYAATSTGGTEVLKDLRVGAKSNDHFIPHQALQQRYWTNRLPEDENFAKNQGRVKLINALKDNLNQWHDLAQLTIPREAVPVGKTWKVASREVTLDYLFGYDAHQQCTLNCEYLGSFTEGARTIGVIRMQGDLVDANAPKAPYGKLNGLALVDASNRQLLDFMVRCDARKRTTSGNSIVGSSPSIDGTMQLRLQRKDS